MARLLLYTRTGCCLCEGLEERLMALKPPPDLVTLDIDTDPDLQDRYGLRVPVLAEVAASPAEPPRELPWVPPRLEGTRLIDWLRRQGIEINGHGPL